MSEERNRRESRGLRITRAGGIALLFTIIAGCSSGGSGSGSNPPANQAPTAMAGPDRNLSLPDLLNLAGQATDDGPLNDLTYAWSFVSGPGSVHFTDPTDAATTASLSEPGTYVLRMTVDDGQLSDSDDLQVDVADVPGPLVGLDPSVRHQTITGWECTDDAAAADSPAWSAYQDELLDLAVDDLGLTRIRLEVRSGSENSRDAWQEWQDGLIPHSTWRSLRYSTVNDDADPATTNAAGFHFSELDFKVNELVLPMRQRVEANGEDLHVNLCYVSFTAQIGAGLDYHHDDPDEYAEFIHQTLTHLNDTFALVPDTQEICLEPDNVAEWSGNLLGQAMAALGPRMIASGFTPRFVAPSTSWMGFAPGFFDDLAAVAGATDHMVELSYHRYGTSFPQHLKQIRDRAAINDLQTANLEKIGADYRVLHEDLGVGQNSAWQQYALAGLTINPDTGGAYYMVDDSDPVNPVITEAMRTPFLKQYFRYIRPGSVRFDATSSHVDFDPLAFEREDGGVVVVVRVEAGATFYVRDLPAGTYGIRHTVAAGTTDLPDRTLIPGEILSVAMPAVGVATIHAK